MGVFAEAYKRCPNCDGRGAIQLSERWMDYGYLDLDDPDHLLGGVSSNRERDELLVELKEEVMEDWFCCEECGFHFNPYRRMQDRASRSLAHRLFDEPDERDDPNLWGDT